MMKLLFSVRLRIDSLDEKVLELISERARCAQEVADKEQLLHALHRLQGQLTATLIAEDADLQAFTEVVPVLEHKVGRLLLNGYPTGVEVCDAMVHGDRKSVV